MLNLPDSTKVGSVLPKERFYTKTSVSNKLRQKFVDEIERIRWTNKISPATLNISSKDYAELQVFEITLKGQEISQSVLKHIDTFIPYPILYVISKPGAVKAAMAFKEGVASDENRMQVNSYFDTAWQTDLSFKLKGRSVDEIYKSFLFQISPKLASTDHSDTKEAVELAKYRLKLQSQIDALNKNILKEPSTSKKQDLARERYKLEQQLNNRYF